MSNIVFSGITEDAESSSYSSSGNMVFSVTGKWKGGSLVFETDIGSGFVVAGTVTTLSPRAFPVLIPAGASFKIKAVNLQTDATGITVEFIDT